MTETLTSQWLFIVPLTLLFLSIFTFEMSSCLAMPFLKVCLSNARICDIKTIKKMELH